MSFSFAGCKNCVLTCAYDKKIENACQCDSTNKDTTGKFRLF